MTPAIRSLHHLARREEALCDAPLIEHLDGTGVQTARPPPAITTACAVACTPRLLVPAALPEIGAARG